MQELEAPGGRSASGPDAFHLDHFMGIYTVLGVGLGTAAAVFAWERREERIYKS